MIPTHSEKKAHKEVAQRLWSDVCGENNSPALRAEHLHFEEKDGGGRMKRVEVQVDF